MKEFINISKELFLSSSACLLAHVEIDGELTNFSCLGSHGGDDLTCRKLFYMDMDIRLLEFPNKKVVGFRMVPDLKEGIFNFAGYEMIPCDGKWIQGKQLDADRFHVKQVDITTPYAPSQQAEILIEDEEYPDKEYPLNMEFYDGYAIQKRNDCQIPLIMLYPTLSMIQAHEEMIDEIIAYGQGMKEFGDITPFDVALKYGEILMLNDL